MARRRRLDFSRGRTTTPHPSPAARSRSSSHGPAHGQGLGLGLYLLATGGSPGQKSGPVLPAAPSFSNSVATHTPGAVGSTLAVALPTYSAGDLVVAQIYGVMGFSDNTASAAGWTQQVSFHPASQNFNLLAVFTRVMTGSEGSSVTFTFAGTIAGQSRPAATATAYTHPNAATPAEVSVATYNPGASTGSWSLGPLTTTGPNRVLLVFGGWNTPLVTYPGVKRFENNEPRPGGGTYNLSLVEVAAGGTGSYTETGTLSQPNTLGGACMIALEAA